MQPYPQNIKPDTDSLLSAFQDISRKREQDITDRNTFPSVFVSGRTVGRVPSASANVLATDRIGDQNLTKDYAYFCVSDGAGGAVWRRIVMATW